MLILELGIWIIPFTLVIAPCRRLVVLIDKLQQLWTTITSSLSRPPAVWRRMARLETTVLMP
ncbi:hypothetical protein COCNU_08G007030 [Cocos nucifera]|uniref:Uncharacterized protein n=1 Tax=Cocos nucifera TaxID=13894 RepID=A0A8K0III2_COCNU|nr:hypothetical protein COCNU_08G007030 [Cocos nucifera]